MKKLFLLLVVAVFFQNGMFVLAEDNEPDSDILTYYYLNPCPDKIPLELEKVINSESFTKNENFRKYGIYNTAYLFGRIAQIEPSLIRRYEDLFERTSAGGRSFIIKIFQVCGDERVKDYLVAKLKDRKFMGQKDEILKAVGEGIPLKFNLLDREIKAANDIDFLWAEFFITGDEKAVRKIIDVLDWLDRIRHKLEAYLTSSVKSDDKQKIMDIFAKEYSIKFKVLNNEIETKDDLDIIISTKLQEGGIKSEPFQEIKKALALTDDDILYMAIKGVANWSLNSNARQHKKVFEICDNEISSRSGSAKIGLLKIASYGYVSDNNIGEAADRLKQLISLDPANAWAHFSLGAIYVENKDIDEARQEEKLLQTIEPALALKLNSDIEYLMLAELDTQKDIEIQDEVVESEMVDRVIRQNELMRTYTTRFTFTDFTQEAKHKGHFTIEWDVEYVFPDRFLVTQSALEKEGPVYDRWITIGKEHYFQIGGWFKEPDGPDAEWRNETNKLLMLDKWLYLMKNNTISSIKVCQSDERRFIALTYMPVKLNYFWAADFSKEMIYNAEIWVDSSRLFIVKAVLLAKGKDLKGNKVDVAYEQVYRGYNSDIKIVKPEDFFKL